VQLNQTHRLYYDTKAEALTAVISKNTFFEDVTPGGVVAAAPITYK
jgi:hypothetical protein